MSIIRQRSKNLLFSGLIGFISACIIISLVYIFVIRGNISVIEWILNDSQLEVMTMDKPVEEEVRVLEEVIRITQKLDKNSIISDEVLELVEVEKELIPENVIKDINDILGKKVLSDIDSKVILTSAMVEEVNVYQVSFETVEIQGVHYPDILAIGQPINIRVHYPTGQDYTILENKNIVHIDMENKSFFINLTDEEILAYSSAIEDKNIYPGTNIYLTIEGQGNIVLSNSDKTIQSLYDKGIDYDSYPLNPNALALSKINNFDTELLDARMILDNSLKAFFDLNSERFSYEMNIEEVEESVVDDDQGIGMDISDEATPLHAASNNESADQGSNLDKDDEEKEVSSNNNDSQSVDDDYLSTAEDVEDTSVDQEPDFDF